MPTPQFESRFQQRRGNESVLPTGLITGLHRGGELMGVRLRNALHQVPDRAQRYVELSGDVRGVSSEPCHVSQSQPYVEIRRASHCKALLKPW